MGHRLPIIPETEYDNLYILTVQSDGSAKLLKLKYGSPQQQWSQRSQSARQWQCSGAVRGPQEQLCSLPVKHGHCEVRFEHCHSQRVAATEDAVRQSAHGAEERARSDSKSRSSTMKKSKSRKNRKSALSRSKGLNRRTFVKLVPALGVAALAAPHLNIASALAQTSDSAPSPSPLAFTVAHARAFARDERHAAASREADRH